MYYGMERPITDLLGRIMTRVERIEGSDGDELHFEAVGGQKWKFYYERDCCASCTIEDIIGDLNDLVGEPILMAEEVSSHNENPEGVVVPEWQDSFTWTFYKFATIKGYVTIRWYGESNGYYSESVTFVEVK